MRVETALAKAALERRRGAIRTKIYHKMTPAELQALTPRFDWARYFRGIGAPPIAAINVTEPEFFKAFNQLLADHVARRSQDLPALAAVVHANAFLLSTAVRRRELPLLQRDAAGHQRTAAALEALRQYVDGDLGEALGQAFVQRPFGPQAKADMLTMVARRRSGARAGHQRRSTG